jgi:phage-related minor tail protein
LSSKTFEAVLQISGMMGDSVKQSVSDVNKQLGIIDKKTIITAAKFAALATAAATALGGIALAAIKSGNDYMRTMNNIAAQTGATGEALQEMGDIAKDIYASGKGENFQEIADALVNIKQASKLAGKELKAAANSAMLLKDTFGMETAETTRAATALMKNFGISAEEAYGIIAVGAQNGANKNGDLLDTLNEYSVHYKALGLDADQFVTSLIKGAEAGSFSIDKIGDAVKEFTIRSKDGSKTSSEAFAQIGLDAETMTAAFAAGGDAAQAAFFQTIKALDAMQDPVAKNAAGVALFGTMFEDLESGVLKTLGGMSGAGVDAAAALKKMEEVKYNDIGYAISQIGRSFEVALLPSAEKAGQEVYKQMPAIKASIEKVTPIVADLGEKFAAALPGIIDNIAGAVKVAVEFAKAIGDNWGWLEPLLMGIVGAFAAFKILTFVSGLLTAFSVAGGIAAGVATALSAAMAFLTSPVVLVAAAIGALIAIGVLLYKNWDTVKAKAGELWEYVTNAFAGLWESVQFYAGQLGQFVSGVWTSIKDGAAQMGQGIKDFFVNAFEALPGLLKTPVNAAISLINGAINGINDIGFTIPDWVPGIGGKAFKVNIPNIPLLAAGGFTDGVSIAGEAGTEAVISFNPAYRKENIGYLMQAAEMLGVTDELNVNYLSDQLTAPGENTVNYYTEQLAALEHEGLAASSTSITYNLGGIVFSPTVTVAGGDEKKTSIIEQLRNYQGDLLELIEDLLASKEAGSYGTGGVF